MRNNSNLHKAKKARNDEFYTQYEDIEKEIQNYNLEEKKIYLNCDDYRYSNFVKYFKDNFNTLKISYLTASNYDNGECAYKYEYDGLEEKITALKGNGDFRSEECVELLKEADVVITNPPFSLFREYIALLMKYDKKFIIIGNINAITYNDIFPLIKDNKLWLGCSLHGIKCSFIVPNEYDGKNVYIKNGIRYGKVNAVWFTNINHNKRNKPLDLYKKYSADEYTKYDNYDAIDCGKVIDIPIGYYGVIGVPITFIYKYCPEQFEIIGLGIANLGLSIGVRGYLPEHRYYRKNIEHKGTVDGDLYYLDEKGKPKVPYARILIRAKN